MGRLSASGPKPPLSDERLADYAARLKREANEDDQRRERDGSTSPLSITFWGVLVISWYFLGEIAQTAWLTWAILLGGIALAIGYGQLEKRHTKNVRRLRDKYLDQLTRDAEREGWPHEELGSESAKVIDMFTVKTWDERRDEGSVPLLSRIVNGLLSLVLKVLGWALVLSIVGTVLFVPCWLVAQGGGWIVGVSVGLPVGLLALWLFCWFGMRSRW